jgi:hypothetical protein
MALPDLYMADWLVEGIEQGNGGQLAAAGYSLWWLACLRDLDHFFFDQDLASDGRDGLTPEGEPDASTADAVLRQPLPAEGTELPAQTRIAGSAFQV